MAAPFDDSEHARIARSNSLQDYMSIPWNDDFRMYITYQHTWLAMYITYLHHIQCDQIGLLSKIFCYKFSYKSSQILWWHLGHLETLSPLSLNSCVYFLPILRKIGLLLVQNLVTLIKYFTTYVYHILTTYVRLIPTSHTLIPVYITYLHNILNYLCTYITHLHTLLPMCTSNTYITY